MLSRTTAQRLPNATKDAVMQCAIALYALFIIAWLTTIRWQANNVWRAWRRYKYSHVYTGAHTQ